MFKFHQVLGAVALCAAGLILSGCGEQKDQAAAAAGAAGGDSKAALTFKIGVCPGPYSEMARKAIVPELEQMGYTVTVVEFTDYIQPNLALESGDIDANLYQHTAYLENLVATQGAKIQPVIAVPTLGMELFSQKVKDLTSEESKAALQDGTAALPNDAINLARALRLARDLGLITLKSELKDENKASTGDIAENPYNLDFVPMEAAQISRSLDSVTLGFIAGNYAYAAGFDMNDALGVEQVTEPFKNLVVVRKGDDKNAELMYRIVHSNKFRDFINNAHEFDAFTRPQWWSDEIPAEADAAAAPAAADAAADAAAAPAAAAALGAAAGDTTAAVAAEAEEVVLLADRDYDDDDFDGDDDDDDFFPDDDDDRDDDDDDDFASVAV